MKKPYRVTAYREYGIARLNEHVVGNFCWYWQANVVSWIWHHLFGFSCNTWKANNEKRSRAGGSVKCQTYPSAKTKNAPAKIIATDLRRNRASLAKSGLHSISALEFVAAATYLLTAVLCSNGNYNERTDK